MFETEWTLRIQNETLKDLSFHFMEVWEDWEYIDVTRDITIMPSLSSLSFYDCPKLKELPDHLPHTTSLKKLFIHFYPTLDQRYRVEKGRDWPRISHIPDIRFDGIAVKLEAKVNAIRDTLDNDEQTVAIDGCMMPIKQPYGLKLQNWERQTIMILNMLFIQPLRCIQELYSGTVKRDALGQVSNVVHTKDTRILMLMMAWQHTERRGLEERAVKDWLDKLKDASYDMDDVLDEWSTAILKLQSERVHKKKVVRFCLEHIASHQIL
ncbi:hypothetical protein Dsin_013880 [Dipteronia sinensis]|uniref:Disease resistance N-terminal domain-containing protein n=1 Tax=Dipteronia sinensis TaxID=43782 RepID=A0AAE0EB12_9ROSI|nr:hypothetical protein Dsin_013880 [Dipteronia sinensis]